MLRISSDVPGLVAHAGSLCVIDQKPRQLTNQQRDIFHPLSTAVAQVLEARRVMRDLATSEAQFRALSAAAPLGVYMTDANGTCTYTNGRWHEIFNLTPTDALRLGWNATLHPDDREAVLIQWSEAAISYCEFDMEFRIKHSNNKPKIVRVISRPIITADGDKSGQVGSVEDISERVNTKHILLEKRRRLQSIIEGTGTGTWEWNIQTGAIRFNDLWASMVGLTLDELQPATIHTWNKLVHPDDTNTAKKLLDQHTTGLNDVYDCELRLRHKEGHWIWVIH